MEKPFELFKNKVDQILTLIKNTSLNKDKKGVIRDLFKYLGETRVIWVRSEQPYWERFRTTAKEKLLEFHSDPRCGGEFVKDLCQKSGIPFTLCIADKVSGKGCCPEKLLPGNPHWLCWQHERLRVEKEIRKRENERMVTKLPIPNDVCEAIIDLSLN